METSPCCCSVTGYQIATTFCTCHDSTTVVPYAKFCSDHCIRIEIRVKRNSHRIWIAMEKPLVKRGPGLLSSILPGRHAHLVGHDDVTKRKHFPCYWPFVRRNHWSPVDSHYNGQWRWAFMFSLISNFESEHTVRIKFYGEVLPKLISCECHITTLTIRQ